MITIQSTEQISKNKKNRAFNFENIQEAKKSWRSVFSRSYERESDGYVYFLMDDE